MKIWQFFASKTTIESPEQEIIGPDGTVYGKEQNFIEKMKHTFGTRGSIVFAIYSVLHIYVGVLAMNLHWGIFWTIAVCAGCIAMRFSLPFTIAAFFGAKDVWGWHWFFSLLFALPSLAWIFPSIVTLLIILATVRSFLKRSERP